MSFFAAQYRLRTRCSIVSRSRGQLTRRHFAFASCRVPKAKSVLSFRLPIRSYRLGQHVAEPVYAFLVKFAIIHDKASSVVVLPNILHVIGQLCHRFVMTTSTSLRLTSSRRTPRVPVATRFPVKEEISHSLWLRSYIPLCYACVRVCPRGIPKRFPSG